LKFFVFLELLTSPKFEYIFHDDEVKRFQN
jgi:hypothetical protein